MKKTGFTLVELVATVAVVGVIATISVPATAEWQRRQQARLAASEFGAMLSLARATAIRSGRLTEFHIDPRKGRFWIEIDRGPGMASDTVGSVRTVRTGVLTVKSNRRLLCFDHRGLPTTRETSRGASCEAADAVVTFKTAARTERVVLTPLGRVDR